MQRKLLTRAEISQDFRGGIEGQFVLGRDYKQRAYHIYPPGSHTTLCQTHSTQDLSRLEPGTVYDYVCIKCLTTYRQVTQQ